MQIGADAIDRAIELHKSGQAESAKEAYQEILQQDPNNADALRLLGVMRLQEGDVIPLARRTNEPIRIFVGAKEKFLAKAGKAGKYRALRVLEVSETHLVHEEDHAHEIDELH